MGNIGWVELGIGFGHIWMEKVVEDFGISDNVYTLHEFAGEEGEVLPPHGGDESVYEASYVEIKDLLYKIKKKLEWN